MEKLNEQELDKLKGGGYWRQNPDGSWIYVDENDEESDGYDIIWGSHRI